MIALRLLTLIARNLLFLVFLEIKKIMTSYGGNVTHHLSVPDSRDG